MRTLIIALGIILLLAQASVAKKIVGFDGVPLLGPVHTERAQVANVSQSSGQLIEGERRWAYINSYDEQGNRIKIILFNSSGAPGRLDGWAAAYDDRGREIECLYDLNEALTYRAITTYDDSGRRALKTLYSTSGAPYHFMEFVFDERGNITRETNLYGDRKVQNITESTYDGSDRLIEATITAPDGAFVQKSSYTYDPQGRKTKSTFYERDGSINFIVSYNYDESGNVSESRRYKSGNLISKEIFTYKFDSHDNWIKRNAVREIIKDGRPLSELEVYYRTITYY